MLNTRPSSSKRVSIQLVSSASEDTQSGAGAGVIQVVMFPFNWFPQRVRTAASGEVP